jgi:hypothetical protein
MRLSIAILFLISICISCVRDDRCGCFDSNGKKEKETRDLSPFYELEVDHVFDVKLHIDNRPRIEITTGKHLFKGIETEVSNNRLHIKNKNKCNWTRKYIGFIKLDIYTDSLTYIRLNGSSNLWGTDTLFGNKIRIDNYSDISKVNLNIKCSELIYALHAGTGDSYLNGSAGVSYFWIMGYGNFHFQNMKVDNCNIMSNTTGSCYVTSCKELHSTIKNSGNIYYRGNPSIITSLRTGDGNLIPY